VPFTLIYARKYVTEDKLKTDTLQKLNSTQKKQQLKIQQNKTSLVQSPHTTIGQEMRWVYSTMVPSQHVAWYTTASPNGTTKQINMNTTTHHKTQQI